MQRSLGVLVVCLAGLASACGGGAPSLAGGAGGQGGEGGAGSPGGSGAGATGATSGAGQGADAGAGGEGGSHEPPVPCDVDGQAGVCVSLGACSLEQEAQHTFPGHCPGPAEVQCCVARTACDPEAFVMPSAALEEPPGLGGCPAGMAPVEDFCVDRWEASLVFADGTPFSPYQSPGGFDVRAVSVPDAVPQGYVSGELAGAACEASGKRLCTDVEWLRACRGPAENTYPYGDTLEPGVCNDARAAHPAIEYFGTTESWIWSELGNACVGQLDDALARTGSHPGCVTDEGLFDMMGNLHEWTADPAGTFRGGFYVDTEINGPGCLYATTAHDTGHWDYSTGFRCCYGDNP